MKCKNVIRELSDFLNGALQPDLLEELQRHLEHCDDCRLVVDTTKKTIQLFCNSTPAPLPSDVHEKLHRALEQKLRRQNT